MTARRVGVVGAGVIGSGVAQALAQTGHDVVLVDLTDEILERVRRNLRRGVRLHHLAAGGEPLDAAAVLVRITFTTALEELADADVVVENVVESWPVKQDVFRRLDRICREDTPLAANTSAIPVTRLASATTRPERVLGIHFMNPVPLKRAAELIRGRDTSEQTVARARALLAAMGIEPIEVGDAPGFVSNRVLMLTVNEAAFVVDEGTADACAVDDVFRKCFGHPMGPLETADLIGLDTVLLSLEVLHHELADDKFRPCPLLERMVRAGLLGRKSGQGFHAYRSRGEQARRAR